MSKIQIIILKTGTQAGCLRSHLKSISIRRNQRIGNSLTRRDGVDWRIIFRETLPIFLNNRESFV